MRDDFTDCGKNPPAVLNKIRSRRGESLTEVLVSLLIASLGLLILAQMLATSSDVVKDSKLLFERYVTAENILSEYSSDASPDVRTGQGKVYFSSDAVPSSDFRLTDSSDAAEITVSYFKNITLETKPVISYRAN